MKPKRIILVRHGESTGNVDPMQYNSVPDYKLPLTYDGRKQALTAGKEIKEMIGDESLHVYLSPWTRTRETHAGIVQSVGQNITDIFEDPRIREQDWGHLRHPDDALKMRDVRNEYGPFFYRMEDGESCADVYDRVSTFFETMHRDFRKDDFADNCLIVTHGMTLRVILMRWFHWTYEEFEDIRNPKNCQIVTMEQNQQGRYDLISPLVRRSDT